MTKIPRYLPEVLKKMAQTGVRPGQIHHITVAHDDWCDLLAYKGPCNCNPVVRDPIEEQ